MAEPEQEPQAEPETETPEGEPSPFVPPELDEVDEAELEEAAESEEPEERPSTNAVVKALEREETRHRNALAKALDVPVEELHPCPTCSATGFTPEPIAPEPELEQDPYLERCARCAGYGEVRTGARPPALVTVPCPGCTGQGYVQKAEHPTAVPELGNGPPTYAPPTPSPQIAQGDADAVADLRARGYMVVEPIVVPESAST